MMNSTDQTPAVCNVCGLDKDVTAEKPDALPVLSVNCKRCGTYTITDIVLDDKICQKNKAILYLLSGAIRYCHEHGLAPYPIDSSIFNTDKFNAKVLPLAPKDDNAKMMLILQYIGGKAASGESVSLDPDLDYPISFSKGHDEFLLLIRTLIQEGLLEVVSGQPKIRVILTVAGRQEIQSLSRPPIGFKT